MVLRMHTGVTHDRLGNGMSLARQVQGVRGVFLLIEKLLLKSTASPVAGASMGRLTVPVAFNCSNELDMIVDLQI